MVDDFFLIFKVIQILDSDDIKFYVNEQSQGMNELRKSWYMCVYLITKKKDKTYQISYKKLWYKLQKNKIEIYFSLFN